MFGLVDGNNFFVSCERVANPKLCGKAVAVLSNNDGCCVSRSNEFKSLGIPMGTPYFKLKDREARGEVIFRSSNYELYADLSNRLISILHELAPTVEQYSIDEAFILPPSTERELMQYGQKVRRTILQWIGIPCGVGFAKTRTLAKIANHIAKKSASGVYVLPDDPTDILAKLPANEVWGIGRKLTEKLKSYRILSALDLAKADGDFLARAFSVIVRRTSLELQGISAIDSEDFNSAPESITYSRTFSSPITELGTLHEALAHYAASAATKLRRYNLIATGANIYAERAPLPGGDFRSGGFASKMVLFSIPTNATNEIIHAIRKNAPSIFFSGTRYRKAGIIFFGIEPLSSRTYDFFVDTTHIEKQEKLSKIVDSINSKIPNSKIITLSQGTSHPWSIKREKISPSITTNWSELLTIN